MGDIRRLLTLERLVAEHLFGWREIEPEPDKRDCQIGHWPGDTDRSEPKERVPWFAREWNFAARVVEHIRQRTQRDIELHVSVQCSCAIYSPQRGSLVGTREYAPTLPEAVCLAALAWAGVTVPEEEAR